MPMDLFVTQLELPLSILLAIALVLGMVIGSAYLVPQIFQQKWKLKQQVKQNQKQANEIIQLKKEVVQIRTQSAAEKTALPVVEEPKS